jgi:S-adenosylmethionine decarboxylase
MAFNDTLFQLGMDLTRSSTAQKEDLHETAPVAQECSGTANQNGDARLAGQSLHIDLVGARRLDSARSAEKALRLAFELAKGEIGSADIRRSPKSGCLSGTAAHADGRLTIEAWPATGYVAVDVVSARAIRPELLLTGLMDAFAAREVMIRRQRSESDGARYKRPAVMPASVTAVSPARRTVTKPARARRAA